MGATQDTGARTISLVKDSALVLAAMQQAVNDALARHKALKQQVVVTGPDGKPRSVFVEQLEAEAAAAGRPITYELESEGE